MKPKKAKSGITIRSFWPAILVCAGLPMILFYAGCNAVGMASVLSSPTSSEAKSSAQYNLTGDKGQKILVLVDQPASFSAYANLRFYLTDTIIKMLQVKAEIKPSLFIDYKTLADFRAGTPDFYMLSPAQVGEKLGADLVLAVTIIDCRITDIGEAGYNGSLDANAALYKVATGEKLWPTIEQSQLVQVGCESERRGQDAACVRMAAAAAHCITRYLYDCPKAGFKISDERTVSGWEK
ncbi:MAG: hypothetical protein ABSG22_10405 [Sedimentisphaerales bacterium]